MAVHLCIISADSKCGELHAIYLASAPVDSDHWEANKLRVSGWMSDKVQLAARMQVLKNILFAATGHVAIED